MPRIVFISDTHSKLRELEIPEGDILIHSGDATMMGRIKEIQHFNNELETIKDKFQRIIFIPGNHDWGFQKNPKEAIKTLTNATDILIDQELTIDGLKIYGSPWQPWFCDWAFNFPKYDNGEQAKYIWSKIPDDTDILVTHGPPYGILDEVPTDKWAIENSHVGCPLLLQRVKILKPKIHSFGHIHEGYGSIIIDEINFINASFCDGDYNAVNKPIVMDI